VVEEAGVVVIDNLDIKISAGSSREIGVYMDSRSSGNALGGTVRLNY
jgi:hypothetical protein